MTLWASSKKNLGKQLNLANKRELNIAVICGDNEFNEGTVTIKILKGIKGQYLIFEDNSVFNIRSNEGLQITIK